MTAEKKNANILASAWGSLITNRHSLWPHFWEQKTLYKLWYVDRPGYVAKPAFCNTPCYSIVVVWHFALLDPDIFFYCLPIMLDIVYREDFSDVLPKCLGGSSSLSADVSTIFEPTALRMNVLHTWWYKAALFSAANFVIHSHMLPCFSCGMLGFDIHASFQ